MEAGIRPFSHLLNPAMLYRVVMNIIDMLLQVVFISNLVLPKPALPDTFLTFLLFALTTVSLYWQGA
jgi:hypothetical protein